MNSCRRVLVAAMLGMAAFGSWAAERVPIEAFATTSKLDMPRLSPDGQHLAVSVDMGEGSHAIVVFRVADMQRTAILRLPRYELPVQAEWVNERRLVIAKGRESGPLDKPLPMGEIIASDFDGTNQKYVYGYEGTARLAGLDRGFGYIAGLPRQPNGHFYMRQLSFNARDTLVYDVDAVKTTGKLVAELGVKDMDLTLDGNSVPRFASGIDDDNHHLLYVADAQGGNWHPTDWTRLGGNLYPVAFTPDNQRLVAELSVDDGPFSLIESDVDGGNRRELAKDGFGNVGDVEWNARKQPFAVTLVHGRPRVVYFDPDSEDAHVHQVLSRSFPDHYVTYVNHSSDGNYSLLYVYSDRDPGGWYLFDRNRAKVSKLISANDRIDPARMGERRYLRFKASDGVELDGWMTLPAGVKEPSKLPMVLLPHGGPHYVSDDWAFDNTAQFLASRGYLVLQVNYRGSDGRGYKFEQSGYRKWGTRVQDDLIDGVRWAIAQGYADAGRICAFGASFGGYSAMMAVVRAPGLFKCAAGQSGLYDLKSMAKKSDVGDDDSGQNYIARAIGTDPKEWAANSPVALAAQIKVPVFLAHGEDDERAPYAQAVAMKKALEAAGNAPEWMSVPDEGHGFYSDANNVAFLGKLQAFLEKNIGPGVG